MATVNYKRAASLIDPNASFAYSDTPNDYDSLVWITDTIPKSDLDTAWLASEKLRQTTTLTDNAMIAAVSGFTSDALVAGSPKAYKSDLQSQIVIVGAMTYLTPVAGTTPPVSYTLPSADVSTGVITFDAYSYTQFFKLFTDMAAFSASVYTQLATKTAAIAAINTGNVNNDLDSVYAIVWA